ncbi:Transmembrane 6 superfamily member 1 [Pseudolycoriella hygida]|uniref:Transmembrane 6 superfamily member 1 n=1 Tax=Pseudolycoriella hygida TaxID=35572 RepID=A0A9Q0N905_9DIPT|nr:Transmembrane 6 superfamily member 1 [Pseudolycoriella hygida]
MGTNRATASDSGVKQQDFTDVKIAFVVSLLAWPITYFVDNGITKVHEDKRTFILMAVGFFLLSGTILFVRGLSKRKSWMNHVFTVFAFTCMIDLIIGLELKGYIGGFMSVYLSIGEPYLSSPWGCAIVLFDGICIYVMYLTLIHLVSNSMSWRSVGIYWVSGLINSMIVLLFGVASGKHNPTFCTFLNVPYAVFPIIIAIRLFSKEKETNWSLERIRANGIVFDLAVAVGLVFSIWTVFAKGMLSIGSQFGIFQDLLNHERALLDVNPAPFAIIQSLVYLFYAAPILLISLVYNFRKRKPQFVWELALINGGTILQAQFSFIVTALDFQTPKELRSDPLDWIFWLNNLGLLIAPQLFIWSLYKSNVLTNNGGKQGNKNK